MEMPRELVHIRVDIINPTVLYTDMVSFVLFTIIRNYTFSLWNKIEILYEILGVIVRTTAYLSKIILLSINLQVRSIFSAITEAHWGPVVQRKTNVVTALQKCVKKSQRKVTGPLKEPHVSVLFRSPRTCQIIYPARTCQKNEKKTTGMGTLTQIVEA